MTTNKKLTLRDLSRSEAIWIAWEFLEEANTRKEIMQKNGFEKWIDTPRENTDSLIWLDEYGNICRADGVSDVFGYPTSNASRIIMELNDDEIREILERVKERRTRTKK